ncbi:MAG TPA: VC0807 family protein [Bdellovibrionota bacterium]|nr:VC0807 family protein [Bdellovibrionota bacterium]
MKQLRPLLIGGLLPVIIFTVIEMLYGTLWGLVAGMVFGVGEITYEWVKFRKVETFTWVGNGMILVLGGVSLLTNEGVWFKLQPAIIEVATAGLLLGSVFFGNGLMAGLMRKQMAAMTGQAEVTLPPWLESLLQGITVRFGLFFLLHAALAAWAAFRWSTEAWAVLKGVGFTVSLILYGVAEAALLRYRVAKLHRSQTQ